MLKAEGDNGLTVMSTVFAELIKDDYLQRRQEKVRIKAM
jgi:hypothetical protein